jgi:hypothetical protein
LISRENVEEREEEGSQTTRCILTLVNLIPIVPTPLLLLILVFCVIITLLGPQFSALSNMPSNYHHRMLPSVEQYDCIVEYFQDQPILE